MSNQYYFVEDCPQCGEKDQEGMYKGARMGSTKWGHDYSCCSDECGFAFANNPKLNQMKSAVIRDKINALKYELESLVK